MHEQTIVKLNFQEKSGDIGGNYEGKSQNASSDGK